MTKLHWCLLSAALVIMLSSFSCSKESTAKENGTEEITVDFRQFPERTILTIYETQGLGMFKFDSDSMKLYTQVVPKGTYTMEWNLIHITPDQNYKAKWLNTDGGTSVNWEKGVYTYSNKKVHGTYIFTKIRK
jgi:hypothetical protein